MHFKVNCRHYYTFSGSSLIRVQYLFAGFFFFKVKFQLHHEVKFDKCTHLCNVCKGTKHCYNPRKLYHVLSIYCRHHGPQQRHDFFHHTLVLPIPEVYVDDTYNMFSFVSGFFHSACLQASTMLQHVYVLHLFL